jgi:hypothetical protein
MLLTSPLDITLGGFFVSCSVKQLGRPLVDALSSPQVDLRAARSVTTDPLLPSRFQLRRGLSRSQKNFKGKGAGTRSLVLPLLRPVGIAFFLVRSP